MLRLDSYAGKIPARRRRILEKSEIMRKFRIFFNHRFFINRNLLVMPRLELTFDFTARESSANRISELSPRSNIRAIDRMQSIQKRGEGDLNPRALSSTGCLPAPRAG